MKALVVTKRSSDVITYVKRQFGDESGVQITDDDILRWINQAQSEIVNKNPMLQYSADTPSIAGTQTYSFPANLLQLESVFYDGNILEPRNFEGVRQELGIDNSSRGVPLYWYKWANEIYLWPVPNAVKTITINYSSLPATVTTPSAYLSVPDRYYERICEFCMSKAYELDEDWTGHKVNKQAFEDKLLEATNADNNMIGAWLVATDSAYE